MMKHIIISIILIISFFSLKAQTINYEASQSTESKSIIQGYTGLNYGVIIGVGYFHRLEVKNHPLWIGGKLETSAGSNILDDHKQSIGAHTTLVKTGNFRINASLSFIHRATKNPYVNMRNMGAELSFNAGIFRPKWFLAGELTFDQTMATHLQHQEAYLGIYDKVRDGWYKTSGGNLQFGLNGGYSLPKIDFTMKLGPSLNSTGRPNMLFFYSLIGVNVKI